MIIKKLRTLYFILDQNRRKLYIYIRFPYFKKHSISESSLLRFRYDVHSQVGQDGIIEEISKRLGIVKGFFIEFGAWDGIHLSNCRNLYLKGWLGAFIEGSSDRFTQLNLNYPEKSILKINNFVIPNSNFKPTGAYGKTLDDLMSEIMEPNQIKSIDLLVIDIDGADLEVMLSSKIRPKIIVIEGGSLLRPDINKAFPSAYKNCQHPLSYIVHQMRSIEYEPVCFHQDLFLVRRDLVERVISSASSISAKQLFIESYVCRDAKFRRWLMLERWNNKEIIEFEKKYFGKFRLSPVFGLANTKL